MEASEAVAVKDLLPLIEDYLNGKHEASQIPSHHNMLQKYFDLFHSELQKIVNFLKTFSETEVFTNSELLNFYKYLKDYDNVDDKIIPLIDLSIEIKFQNIFDEKISEYFYFGFDFGDRKEILKYEIFKGTTKYNLYIDVIVRTDFENNFLTNLDDKIMEFGEFSFIADKTISPRLQEDKTNIKLVVYGNEYSILSNISIANNSERNPFLIKVKSRPLEFEQIPEMSFVLTPRYNGSVVINFKVISGNSVNDITRTICASVQNWKEKFVKHFDSSVKIKFKTFNNEFVDVKITTTSSDDPLMIDKIEYQEHDNSYTNDGQVQAMNYMFFEITVADPPPGGLFESFKSKLTKKGEDQLKFLEKQLLKDSKIVRDSGKFYASFTTLVQSSGFGKSKLSVEMLKKYPGMYIVFRKQGETGIPNQSEWSKEMFHFVFQAPKDDLPNVNELAIHYAPTRFLLALEEVILKYMTILRTKFTDTEGDRSKAIEDVAKLTINDPQATDTINDFSINFNVLEKSTKTVKNVIDKIFEYLNLSNENDDAKLMMQDRHADFPFFLFLDEADHLNNLSGGKRVPGVNVIRRGLHLLKPETRILVVAIGTNSDVLDFMPTIGDNSLRFFSRTNLIPPFIISKNWDIYSEEYPYRTITVNEANLLNIHMFKVLVSLGRPLWCSSPLETVISLAEVKLANGDSSKFSALFALLMIRATHTVNSLHMLSRTLVRSYMAMVRYVSTNGQELKITYSSEPVLAMAARNMLKDKESRFRALFALKAFLQCQAIDKGRIVETIFEHMTLFAIDDADIVPISLSTSASSSASASPSASASASPSASSSSASSVPRDESENIAYDSDFPVNLEPLLNCTNHLLELNKPSDASPTSEIKSDPTPKNYRVVTVRSFLTKLLGTDEFNEIEPFISVKMLDGYVNCTHFVNLKRFKKSDFEGLRGQIDTNDSGCSIIDRALLHAGLLRQCGFVMPPGYLGIDFIVPVLMKTEPSASPIYTYIGIQSKSTSFQIIDALNKMNPNVHYNVSDDQSNEEMIEIMGNSLVIVMTHKGPTQKGPFNTYGVSSVYLNDECSILNNITHELPSQAAMISHIVKNCISLKGKIILGKINVTFRPPEEGNVRPRIEPPKLIISKNVNSKLSFYRLLWNNNNYMSAIVIHDITVMDSLVDMRTFKLIDEIVNFSTSIFDEVGFIQRGLVQDGLLTGSFCENASLNSTIRYLRNKKDLEYNIDDIYFNKYTESSVNRAIISSIKGGPENASFSESEALIDLGYFEAVEGQAELGTEMEIVTEGQMMEDIDEGNEMEIVY